MEKNPGRYGIAALAIATLLGAAACERGTDNTATGLSERGSETRSAESSTTPSEQTASTSPGTSSSPEQAGSPAPGSLASSDDAGSARSDASPGSAAGSSASGTAGVSGYTGPAGSAESGTGTAPSGASGAAGGSATTGGPAAGGETAAGAKRLSSTDRNFLREAARDGMYEIEVARVAAERATDPQVKSFASKIVDDHTKANEQLQQIARSRNVTLPTDLPAAKQRNVERLRSASGPDFDRQFLQMVGVKGHKEDIAEFERASRRARDADIREFARSTLPTLREHLSSAQQLAATIGTGAAGSTPSTPQGFTGEGGAGSMGGEGTMGGTTGSSPGETGTTPTPQTQETPQTPQGFTGPGSSEGGSAGGSTGSGSGQY